MIKEVLKMGHPLLLEKANLVLPHEFGSQMLVDLIQDLEDTRLHYGGVGIAAPQIGISKQVVIIKYTSDNPRYNEIGECPLTVIINPSITISNHEKSPYMEGYLSVPNLKGEVMRPIGVKYTYYDIDGNQVQGEDNGFFARVLQHECDHLNGILYPMKISDFTKFGFIDANL